MTQEDFLKSLSPEQTEAFVAIRDAIHVANGEQNAELTTAKQAEVDAANAERDAARVDKEKATQERDDAIAASEKAAAAQASALAARDSTVELLKSIRALLAQQDASLDAAIVEAAKSNKEKELAAAQAEFDAAQARIAALQ